METEEEAGSDLVSEIKIEQEEIHVDFIKTEERNFVSLQPMTGTDAEVTSVVDPDTIDQNSRIKQEPTAHEFERIEIEEETSQVQDSFLPEPEQSESPDRKFVCDYCKKKYLNNNSLRVHLNSYHRGFPHKYSGEIIQCRFCREVCDDFETLKKHALENHPTPPPPRPVLKYECAHCGKRVGAMSTLRRHMVTHSKERPHQCSICLKTFKSLNQRKDHQRTVHVTEKLVQCPECPKTFKTQIYLNQHRQVHNVGLDFKCTECEKSFKTKKGLRKHSLTHNDVKLPCKVCGKMFKSSSGRRQHFEFLHKPPEERKSFECSVCSKSFMTNTNMKNHALTHTDEKPFKCQICPKEAAKEISFRSRNGLNSHMNSVHYSKTFTCSVCSKTFSVRSSLNTHMRDLHSDKKPKKAMKPRKCTICQEEFKSSYLLKKHMMKIH